MPGDGLQKAPAAVRHSEAQLAIDVLQRETGYDGFRVFGNVVEAFLGNPEDTKAALFRQAWQIFRNVDGDSNTCGFGEFFAKNLESDAYAEIPE